MRNIGILLAFSTSTLWADSTITAQYTTGAQTTETTVSSKGVRQRFETKSGGVLIVQPDQQRMLELNPKDKTYQTIPLSAAESTPARHGGTVTYTTTVNDTGETRLMFGITAKHVKTTVIKEASADACDAKGSTVETDGWYVELPAPARPDTATSGGCIDDVKYVQNGASAKGMTALGYPVQYSMTTTDAGGKPQKVSMKVTALDRTELASALFDVPPGYSQTVAKEGAAPKPADKAAGAMRVGVVMPKDKTLSLRSPITFQDQLVGSLTQAGIEAVPLAAENADEARNRAKELQCDYVLLTEVDELKKPQPSKVGGLLKRLPVGGPTADSVEAKVSYQLLSVANGTPKAAAEATGKTGGFTWRNAVQLTTTVGMFAMTRYAMIFSPQMSMMFLQMQGTGTGGSPVSMLDPMMSGFLSFTSRGGQRNQNKPDQSGEAAATGAALQQVAKGVLGALGKN